MVWEFRSGSDLRFVGTAHLASQWQWRPASRPPRPTFRPGFIESARIHNDAAFLEINPASVLFLQLPFPWRTPTRPCNLDITGVRPVHNSRTSLTELPRGSS